MNTARLQDLMEVDNIKTDFRKSWKASWKIRQGKTLTPTPQAVSRDERGKWAEEENCWKARKASYGSALEFLTSIRRPE
uniref:Transposase n=1 Tax=Echinococcus granulosus TaxID=6210 RepID=A0A068WJ90_ECHGR|nr:hypothetical protein EgrG_001044800 [Echinococcus granulosus]